MKEPDLSKILRAQSSNPWAKNWEVCLRAADEIDRLRAQVAALEAELDRLRADAERWRREASRFDREPPGDCPHGAQCLARGACWQKCSLMKETPK